MDAQFAEVTDGIAYGKFMVARLDTAELNAPSAMPEAPPGTRLLTYSGRRRMNDHTTLVIDLQRGTAAAWPLNGPVSNARHYLTEHLRGLERLVCPMYIPFVGWLYEQDQWGMGEGSINTIPRYIDMRATYYKA